MANTDNERETMVLQLGTTFSDYNTFKQEFARYQRSTHQLFVTGKSKSVAAANKSLLPDATKYGDALQWADITLVCKNGGKSRCKSTGVRPNQR